MKVRIYQEQGVSPLVFCVETRNMVETTRWQWLKEGKLMTCG